MNTLDILTDDCLLHILHFLTPPQLCITSAVCQRFKLLADSDVTWRGHCSHELEKSIERRSQLIHLRRAGTTNQMEEEEGETLGQKDEYLKALLDAPKEKWWPVIRKVIVLDLIRSNYLKCELMLNFTVQKNINFSLGQEFYKTLDRFRRERNALMDLDLEEHGAFYLLINKIIIIILTYSDELIVDLNQDNTRKIKDYSFDFDEYLFLMCASQEFSNVDGDDGSNIIVTSCKEVLIIIFLLLTKPFVIADIALEMYRRCV